MAGHPLHLGGLYWGHIKGAARPLSLSQSLFFVGAKVELGLDVGGGLGVSCPLFGKEADPLSSMVRLDSGVWLGRQHLYKLHREIRYIGTDRAPVPSRSSNLFHLLAVLLCFCAGLVQPSPDRLPSALWAMQLLEPISLKGSAAESAS